MEEINSKIFLKKKKKTKEMMVRIVPKICKKRTAKRV